MNKHGYGYVRLVDVDFVTAPVSRKSKYVISIVIFHIHFQVSNTVTVLTDECHIGQRETLFVIVCLKLVMTISCVQTA